MRRVDLDGTVEKTEVAPSDLVDLPPQVAEGALPPLPLKATAMAAGPDTVVTTCETSCETLTVYRRGEPERQVALPTGLSLGDVRPGDVAFSPDGARMAFVNAAPDWRLVVLDLGTGRLEADEPVDGPLVFPTRSPDGRQLFWVTYSYGEASTVVGRIDVDTGVSESVRLPFGGTLRAIVVDRAQATGFMPAAPGPEPGGCPPPTIQPSNRTGVCGFRVTAEPASLH